MKNKIIHNIQTVRESMQRTFDLFFCLHQINLDKSLEKARQVLKETPGVSDQDLEETMRILPSVIRACYKLDEKRLIGLTMSALEVVRGERGEEFTEY